MKVYIDGENFRKGITRVLEEAGLIKNSRDLEDYRLRELLQDVLASNETGISYYASKIKLPNGYKPSDEVMTHVTRIREYSRKWIPNLEKQDIDYVKAGYLKVRSSKACRECGGKQDVLQEKGVDVRLATDMLEDAYQKTTDIAVLFSSDTDLCPAIHKIQKQGGKVIYLCFADSVNRAVSAVANETVSIPIEKLKIYMITIKSDIKATKNPGQRRKQSR